MAVYFIQRMDETKLIKIGMSKNAHRRHGELAAESDVPLQLLGVLEDGREWLLHQEFAEHRVEGEWFHPVPALRQFIERHCHDGDPVPWDEMIEQARQAGKNVPLRSLFTRTIRWGDVYGGMGEQEAFEKIVNTALAAREDGHPIIVRHARIKGQPGLLVFIPGYQMENGSLQPIQEPAPAPAEPA